MGAILSFAGRHPESSSSLVAHSEQPCKRARLTSDLQEHCHLIPGIPDEIAISILARLSRIEYFSLRLVCRSWYNAFLSKQIFDIRRDLHITEEWLYVLIRDTHERLSWHAMDPVSGKWQRLPPMPETALDEDVGQVGPSRSWWGLPTIKFSGLLRFLLRRRDTVDASPFCGCAAESVDGCLYVLGGFTSACATKSVWCYDPRINEWKEVAAMGTPRAYCKTALLHNKLYVVGGVNRGRGGLTPLQSGEVYEPSANVWRPIPNMPFAKAQVLPTAFLADMIKPIATGMAAYTDRLCVPQSLYSWPFFVDLGGEIFDPVSESWMEMPRGMGEGWPARQAGTKLSAVVNGKLYTLDPTSSLDGSKIKVYDSEADSWNIVLRKVPILLDLSDSESPYLLASFGGRLHVLTKDITDHIVVLRADLCGIMKMSSSSSSVNAETELGRWTTIARKSFGTVELVICQILDV